MPARKEEKELPVPMVTLNRESSPEPSKINRLTLRWLSIRERASEKYQDFPENEYVGCEVLISHQQAAYIVPDMKLGTHVTKLNTGWIDEPRMVVILNKTIWKGSVHPTPAQRAVIASSVVLIGFSATEFPIRIGPKQQQPLLLTPGTKIYLRAEAGSPIVSIFAA